MAPRGTAKDSQARDQDQQQQARKAFTQGLIKAIEDAEAKRASRSAEAMAAAAYDKLQYDFPAVSAEELQALLADIRASLDAKSGWTPYQLTTKFVENIAAGARRMPPPQATSSQQDTAASTTLSSSSLLAAQPVSMTTPLHVATSRLQLYQQLHAAIVLHYVCRLLSLSNEDAWAMLSSYTPDSVADTEPEEQPLQQPEEQPQQQQEQQQHIVEEGPSSFSDADVPLHLLQLQSQPAQPLEPVREAAEPDQDGELYEDIEPPSCSYNSRAAPLSNSRANGNSRGSRHQQAHATAARPRQVLPQQPFSWPALQCRLLGLVALADYSMLSDDTLWRLHGAGAQVLTLLRALGAHAQAAELAPALHAYVSLLVDRVSAVPADITILEQLWEALGVGALTALPQHGLQQQQQQQQQGQLPQEAVLAFSTALSVGQQLGASSVARGRLWQQIHTTLLPAVERCAEKLAGSKPAAGGSCADDDGLASALLLAQLLEWYVCNAPRDADVGASLVNTGTLRALVQLFVRHGAVPAGEPLRRALLLAAAAALKASAWAGAVPGVRQLLASEAFGPGGVAAAHGAVWGVLLAPEGDSQQLLGVLEAAAVEGSVGGESSGLVALHSVLQLLGDAHAAASGRRLWGGATETRLRALHAALREALQGGGSDAPVVASRSSVGVNGLGAAASTLSNGSAEQGEEQQQGRLQHEEERDEQHGLKRPVKSAAELELSRARQLQSACLTLLKGLLEENGKND